MSLADHAETNTGRGIIYALEDIAKQMAAANAIAAITATHPNGAGVFSELSEDPTVRELIRSAIREFTPPEVVNAQPTKEN